MSDTSDRFKRAPRRKTSKVKRISMTADEKQAYAKLIEDRVKREQDYARHLPESGKPR